MIVSFPKSLPTAFLSFCSDEDTDGLMQKEVTFDLPDLLRDRGRCNDETALRSVEKLVISLMTGFKDEAKTKTKSSSHEISTNSMLGPN